LIVLTRPRFAIALVFLASLLVVAGCSNPHEDVRVTLCKHMVLTQIDQGASALTWTGIETETRGHEYAAVRLRFSASDRSGEAACYYNYDAVDETALTVANPIAAYSTSPSRMSLNGRTLSKSALAQAVKKAMLKQGKDLVERARKQLE
jgi:hypothetical protein